MVKEKKVELEKHLKEELKHTIEKTKTPLSKNQKSKDTQINIVKSKEPHIWVMQNKNQEFLMPPNFKNIKKMVEEVFGQSAIDKVAKEVERLKKRDNV